MSRDIERRTIEVLQSALGRRVYPGTVPEWLQRPGRDEIGPLWRTVRLIYRRLTDGMELPDEMPVRERRTVDGLIGGRGLPYRFVEVDESQHFNPFRAMTLQLYPKQARVAYPISRWIEASERGRMAKGGGWAAPKPPLFPMDGGRHRQRAFRDALTDLLPPSHGFAPTLRIADFEVAGWLWERGAAVRMRGLVAERLEASMPSDNSEISRG